MPTLDFGFNANPTDSGTEPVTDLDTGVTGTVGSDGNIIPPIDEPNNDGQDNNGKTDGDGKKDDVNNPATNFFFIILSPFLCLNFSCLQSAYRQPTDHLLGEKMF